MPGRKRLEFTFLASLVTIFKYTSELTLPFTITAMSSPQDGGTVESVCTLNGSVPVENAGKSGNNDFAWTDEQYGNILGAFFIGYSISTIGSAFATQKYGFYPLIKVLCFGSATTTLLFPFVVRRSYQLGCLLRVLLGIFSGPYVPALQGSWYWWGIPSELTTNIAIQSAGVTIGNILGSVGSGMIIDSFGWEYCYYVAGTCQIFVGLLWAAMVDPKPDREREAFGFCGIKKLKISSRMSKEEKSLIKHSRPASLLTTELRDIPFRSIIIDPQVLLALLGLFSFNLIMSSTISVPTYLTRAFGLPLSIVTYVFGTVALGCLIASLPSALIVDKLRKKYSTTFVRKSMIVFFWILMLPSVCCIKIFGCNFVGVSVLFSIYIISTAACGIAGILPIAAELSANFGPIVTGFAGGIGNFAGFASTSLMVYLLKDKNQDDPANWNQFFVAPVGFFTVFMGFFLAFGKIEVRPWAKKRTTNFPFLLK
ncbi:Oidioi.mRNA.OKI2018_I69.chr2.g4005.t1.cds [Oikopleura dioica]|uniref:Oidioi.mRNA.OKI2018_I69.chr2.g4005.t1.cds n=1 Tax=Oikopleura dioica TaxID=34765 RepID=A0ABN7T1G0_OIKDI|nr:Oidioi.mRNA.OKI2018_I69.chr2.g4005.t1.cds [Oikopleura dioica]